MTKGTTVYDLVLRGGRVVDPLQDLDAVADVAFAKGRVAAIGDGLASAARTVSDVSGAIVVPGLIDLHTHVYWGGTSLGVDAARLARGGCTTLVDTGSAGPGNFRGFLEHVIRPSPVRIIPYLNVSFAGIFGFARSVMVGESHDLRLVSAAEAIEVASAHRADLAGIKVRVGRNASGQSGLKPLLAALEVVEVVDLPMMVHIDFPPPNLADVLALMRPGDVLTHAFRPPPNAPVTADGEVEPFVLEARQRGIHFDIGHGMGSFSFAVARTMLGHGFQPDSISSDVHALCIDGPAFDLLTTASKFICLGMPLKAVIRAMTQGPARALSRPDLGTLRPGSVGDATVLVIEEGRFDYVDTTGERLEGNRRLAARSVVIDGAVWHESEPAFA